MTWTNPNASKGVATVAWANETRAAIATHDGIGTSASIGVTVTFAVAFSTVDDYGVEYWWQEDPGPNSGDLFPVKAAGSCVIMNTGSEYGKKFYYRIVPKKGL